MNKQVEINIEKLMLHGFEPGDRLRIGQALEQRLKEAFAMQQAGVPKGGDIYFADAGSFEMQPNAKPEEVGNQVANSVFKKIKET
jgi:hypothetical protein